MTILYDLKHIIRDFPKSYHRRTADLLYVGEGLTRFSTMFSTIMTILYDLKHIIRDFPQCYYRRLLQICYM